MHMKHVHEPSNYKCDDCDRDTNIDTDKETRIKINVECRTSSLIFTDFKELMPLLLMHLKSGCNISEVKPSLFYHIDVEARFDCQTLMKFNDVTVTLTSFYQCHEYAVLSNYVKFNKLPT